MEQDALTSYNNITCSASVIISKLLRLSQICGGGLYDENTDKLILLPSNAKLNLLSETIEEINKEEQIVIWARFNFEIETIQDRLIKEGISCVTFYGKDSDDQRIENRLLFREKQVRAFIGSPATGGKGLNDLVGCNTVIYYSNDYNAENREQSECRNHRQGTQGDKAVYIDLLVKGTIDVKVLRILKQNKSISDAVLERSLF